ncbi:MAG: DUF669 domain-containing protein [Spirochaetales bacterium]|nr:DUF669 domain-containing protein [Spirochaetales bacterium]
MLPEAIRSAIKKPSYELIPDGDQITTVTKLEHGTSQFGDWTVLTLELTISEGKYARRKVWETFDLGHPDAEIAGKAMTKFQYFTRACGYGEGTAPLTLEPYIGKTAKVRLRHNENSGRNTVALYLDPETEVTVASDIPF